MNKQVKLIISIIVCVVLFAGVGLLYNNLKDKPMDETTVKVESSSEINQSNEASAQNATNEQATNEKTTIQQTTKEQTTKPQIQLQDITFYDENKNPVKLSDFKGKKVVLNLWATWCGYCIQEMPDFQKAYENNKDNIQFIMLNVEGTGDKSIQTAKDFINKKGFSFPLYYDIDMQSNAYMSYTRGGIPATFFIDEKGNLIAMQPGAMNSAMLQKGIDMLMEG